MTRTADKLAKAKQRLEENEQNLKADLEAIVHKFKFDNDELVDTTEGIKAASEQVEELRMSAFLFGFATGSLQAAELLVELLEDTVAKRAMSMEVTSSEVELLNSTWRRLTQIAREALDGKVPQSVEARILDVKQLMERARDSRKID